MTKIVESRKLKIRLQIEEKEVGSYGHETVATQELTVPLPITRERILTAIGDQLDLAVAQVEIFRGTTIAEEPPKEIAAAPAYALEPVVGVTDEGRLTTATYPDGVPDDDFPPI